MKTNSKSKIICIKCVVREEIGPQLSPFDTVARLVRSY